MRIYRFSFMIITLCIITMFSGCGLNSSATERQETSQPGLPTPQTANISEQQKTPQETQSQVSSFTVQPGMGSWGASGMVDFLCFDGCIYKYTGDSQGMIITYKQSEISAKPIGNTYDPLSPDPKYNSAVYSVSGVQNAAGLDAPQTIAVLDYENSNDFWYCRADFIIKGTFVYNKKTYLIAPAVIPGMLSSEKFKPFKTDKKLGTTTDGYDVYSLKDPQKSGELAVDIPQMTCADFLGKENLYPLAIPR